VKLYKFRFYRFLQNINMTDPTFAQIKTLQAELQDIERKRDLFIQLTKPLKDAIRECVDKESTLERLEKEHLPDSEIIAQVKKARDDARKTYSTALNHYGLLKIHYLLDAGMEIDCQIAITEGWVKLPSIESKKSDKPETIDALKRKLSWAKLQLQMEKLYRQKYKLLGYLEREYVPPFPTGDPLDIRSFIL
jgi:hypothetical protein